MFEKYTENARRVVFFARYEASQFGSPYIEPEHLLLGLLRQDKALTNRLLRSHASIETIRKQIEGRTAIREKVSTSVDLPLSNECKRVLAYAADEAERLSHKHIGAEHLLLGLLREEKCFAAEILHECGLKLAAIREELARTTQEKAPQQQRNRESSLLEEFSRDLTQAAMDSQLNPVIGRDRELEGVIEVLCSRNNRNPVLIGERGAGKTAVVEGLAQLIADGDVPSFLSDKRILAFDSRLFIGVTSDRQKLNERLNIIVKELKEDPQTIFFIDDLLTIVGNSSISGSLGIAEILRPALLRCEIQCIGASTPDDHQKAIQLAPWLGQCFRAVKVPPLHEDDIIRLLFGCKADYEKYHAVSYTDEALQYAVHYAIRHFRDSTPLSKSIELLDAAGARVKLRQASLPEEIADVQKRIKFIVHRMEKAIAMHEFAKAKFYSDEERKERENLRALRDKYHLDDSTAGIVSREDIEDVVSRWTGVPISSVREDFAAEGLRLDQSAIVSAPQTAENNLRVFMCHSSGDKPAVRNLYEQLKKNHIDPWLDEENLLPGHDWDYEITNAVRSTHVVVVCLSAHSVSKTGYLQKEIRKVLDIADEQPENAIFLIPLKLEECEVPSRLKRWHWVNLFEAKGFDRLMRALLERAHTLGISPSKARFET